MIKYIDAEKLIAEIERLKSVLTDPLCNQGNILGPDWVAGGNKMLNEISSIIASLQQEHPEVDLEKFTEKMGAWKARYNHPDNIPIKATMAFTARMFYMYPNVAREWYERLPKATMD